MTSMAHDPKCIALKQLETALRLYFEQEDYYSVITLAGASEEIFGKLLNENARENSLDSLKKSVSGLFKHLYSEDLDEKEIVTQANDARNKLKHETGVCEFDAPEEAKDMLNRAIKNYYSLTHNPTPAMDRFQAMHVRDKAISEFPKWRKYLISLSFRGQSSVRPVQVGGFDVNIDIHRSTAVRGRGGPARHHAWPPYLGAILAHTDGPCGS